MPILPIHPNKLAFPGTAAGVNPSHPATRGTKFSLVSQGANFIDLLSARSGTISSTPTATNLVFPGISFTGGSNNINFASGAGGTYLTTTLACIVYFNAVSGSAQQIILANTGIGNNGGCVLQSNNANICLTTVGVADNLSGIVPSANVPYFIVASVSSTAGINFVVRRLDNGQVFSKHIAASTPTASTAGITVGNWVSGSGFPTNGQISAAMFNDKYLSLNQLLQWADDPWGFWYPQIDMPIWKAPSAAATPPFIPNSNENFNVRQLATRAAAVILCATQATTFAVPPSATPTPKQFGWYQQLSKSAAVAQAKPGSTFVPFNTAQVVPAVAKGWYNQLSPMPKAAVAIPTLPTQFAAPYQNTIPGIAWHRWQDPVNGGVRNARAQPTQTTQFAVPASVAPPAQTPGQFGWWANLSKAAPVAQAKPGNAFVPFNTTQVVISPQTVPLNYDAGSVQQRVVYYQSSFQVLRPIAVTPNTITGIAWFQPLGIPAPVAQAKPGSTFVPLNTTQITNTVTAFGWYQPLSVPAKIATAQQGNTFVPLNTRQVNSITGIGWYQNLSRPAPVAIAQAGFSFVPFNTKQVVTVQVAFDPFVKKRSKPKRDRLRDELEIKYKRRLAIEEAFWPPTTYELPPYKLPEHVKPAPDVSDLANVIMQVQQMRAAATRQQDEDDEKALLELLKREYGIEDV